MPTHCLTAAAGTVISQDNPPIYRWLRIAPFTGWVMLEPYILNCCLRGVPLLRTLWPLAKDLWQVSFYLTYYLIPEVPYP